MKKKITLLSIAFISGMLLLDFNTRDVHSNNSGAPAGQTGSPGDNSTCGNSSCHNNTTAPETGMMVITSNIPSSGYISGNTYTISVVAGHATFGKFGFQVSPQSTTGIQKGTLVVTDNTQMQLVGNGKYITHKSGAGTQGTNTGFGFTKQWQFDWTAPGPGSGPVTFYGATLFANANNAKTGDSVSVATLVVQESSTSGINTVSNSKEIKLFPNPANYFVNISLPENAEIFVMDISGKIMIQKNLNTGINNIDISQIPSGIYFAKIEGKEHKDKLKFIKQ